MPYNLSIPGQVSEHQLKAIEAVAALVPKNGKVVEVGSLFGCSSWAWAKSVDPSVTVYCIDPWEGNEGVRTMEARLGITYGLEQFLKHTADCPNIKAMQGYSPTNFQDWADPIDLYYEDAVHTNPILAQNLDFWSAKLKPGGILCGDDYRPRFPDVMSGAAGLARKFGRELIRVDFFWCLLPDDGALPGSDRVADRLRELSAEHDALKRGRGPVFYIGPRKPVAAIGKGATPVIATRASNESLDPWPSSRATAPLTAGVRITSEAEPATVLAETRVALGVDLLPPDVPVDFDVPMPVATLAPGRYRAVFDLVAPDGGWTMAKDASRAAAVTLVIGEQAAVEPATAGASRRQASGARQPVLDTEVATRDFTSAAFADSHGAFDRHLGAGMLYYALGHLVRSQVSVCIGSGGGFVPSLMRRAQLDAGIEPSMTCLVDANLPDLAFGSPIQPGGWMTAENRFLERENDIVVLPMLSVDAAALLARNSILIDHLHIDGDHSAKGVLADFQAFAPLLSAYAVVSLHDLRMAGVDEALAAIRELRPDMQLLSFPEVGNGTGVLRRTLDRGVDRRRQTVADLADPARRLAIDRSIQEEATTASQHRARFERWGYLETPPYRVRYALAAEWVDRAGEAIVEVGGFPNSIAHFASRARAVHAIEAYTTPEFENRITQSGAERGFAVSVHPTELGKMGLDIDGLLPFNLVALGLDLTSGARTAPEIEAALERFLTLMSRATRVALEAPRYKPSMVTLEHVLRIAQPTIVRDITLDFSKDPVADSFHVKDNRALRRLLLLEPRAGLEPTCPGSRALIASAAAELAALLEAETRPADTDYRLGSPLEFILGGNAEPYKRGGWVGAEKHHTWMQGPESQLVVTPQGLDALAPSRHLEPVMACRPFLAPGKLETQGLAIRVNGREVMSMSLREAQTVRCLIPLDVAREAWPMRIAFLHPDATRPCDVIEGSVDKKPLAIAVSRITISAVEPARSSSPPGG